MQRGVAAALAMSVLVSACALIVAPPPPPGTHAVVAEVNNRALRPVELSVRLPTAGGTGTLLAGAVQPATAPPGPSSTTVTFYLPLDGHWAIDISGYGQIDAENAGLFAVDGCSFGIELDRDGGWGFRGC